MDTEQDSCEMLVAQAVNKSPLIRLLISGRYKVWFYLLRNLKESNKCLTFRGGGVLCPGPIFFLYEIKIIPCNFILVYLALDKSGCPFSYNRLFFSMLVVKAFV